jgi:hypothetical protein
MDNPYFETSCYIYVTVVLHSHMNFFLEHSYNQGKLKVSNVFTLEINQHTA